MTTFFMRIFFAVFLLSFYLVSCSDKKIYNQEITPPFKNVDVAYHQLEVDASEDKVIHLTNGSSISVPKNAFVDKDGNPVTGKVTLEYREFHTAADIIASGIPMAYEDEKGAIKHLESGGMFEIKGKVNNEEVFISKGKELNVSMASSVPGEFDFYYLEEETNAQQAEASLAFIGNVYGQDNGSEKRKVRWLKLTNNVDNPAIAEKEEEDKDAKYFNLQFDTSKFPDTKILQEIKWQLAKEGEPLNPLDKDNLWVSQEKWGLADVSHPKKNITLKNEASIISGDGRFLYWKNRLEDTSRVILYDGSVSFYDFSGEKTASISDTTIIYIQQASSNSKRIVTASKGGDNILWSLEGKKIKNLGNSHDLFFLKDGSRLVYTDYSVDGNVVVNIIDQDGKEISKITLLPVMEPAQNQKYYYLYRDIKVTEDRNYFVTYSGEGIRVWDGDGKLIKSALVSKSESARYIKIAPYKNSIIFYNEDLFKIWDWKSDKWFSAPMEEGVKVNSIFHEVCHPTAPKIIIHTKNDSFILWDWEKNSSKKFEYNSDGHREASFFKNGPLIAVPLPENISNGNNSYNILNDEGKLISEASGIEGLYCIYPEDKSSVIFRNEKGMVWMDIKGKIIKDFRNYDSTIVVGTFKGNDKVMTLSNGNLITWGKDGNMLSSFTIDEESKHIIKITDNYIFTVSRNSIVKVFDYKGNLISNVGFVDNWLSETPNENILVLYSRDKVGFWNIASDTLPANVYQLALRSASKSFITYVKLSKSSLEKIQEYTKVKEEKLRQEYKRAGNEKALLRSFQIRKFGIYNWDKFSQDENMIAVNANFDFGSSATGYNDVILFLIMGKDQNTVIKYFKGTWDKFKFDPSVPNQLLAILPNDQIAIFDRKEFEKVNGEEIKKSGKYTFKMKVLDKVESVGALDKILKTPS